MKHLIKDDPGQLEERILKYLDNHWKFFLAEGFVFIILGIAAITLPHIFTVGVALFFGWLLLIGGLIQIVRALSFYGMPGFRGWLFLGFLQSIIGYLLVVHPWEGVLTLTLLFTLLFALEGLGKLMLAFRMRPFFNWGWVLFSGITSLLFAIVVWIGWPGTAQWILGLFLGINMLMIGFTLVRISLAHADS
jgi:uncharacterized membrane protein HdeD (DUF308 family)